MILASITISLFSFSVSFLVQSAQSHPLRFLQIVDSHDSFAVRRVEILFISLTRSKVVNDDTIHKLDEREMKQASKSESVA